MLSLKGCNAADQFRTLTHCRSVAAPRALNRQGIAVVSCCSSPLSRTGDLAISEEMNSSGGTSSRSTDLSMNLAEELQFGRLSEDKLSYKMKFIMRWYEVGFNNTAAVIAINDLLQEAGTNHLQCIGYSKDGFGKGYTMRQLHLIWVITRMHIEVYKYPAWGDVIQIETWLEVKKIWAKRDWIIRDATGTVIGRATSKWLLMNQDTRKLPKIREAVFDDLPSYCVQTPRSAFPEDNSSMKRIPKLEGPAQYSRLGIKPSRADVDMHQHVNNASYIGWVLESMPQEIIDTHELQKLTLDYKRECRHGDMVDSLTNMELMEGSSSVVPELSMTNGSSTGRKHEEDCCQFLHFLIMSGGGPEITRGRTEWRRKPMN